MFAILMDTADLLQTAYKARISKTAHLSAALAIVVERDMSGGEGKLRISANSLLLSLGKMPERGTDTSDGGLSARFTDPSHSCLARSPSVVVAW